MIQVTNKQKIIITSFVVYSVALVAVGRYLTPEKVKIETKIVTVESKVDNTTKDQKTHKKIVITEKRQKDGEVDKTVTITDNVDIKDKTIITDDTQRSIDKSKEVTHASDKVTVSALAGVQFNLNNGSPLIYGASITKPILGPLTIGIWGLSNASGGFSLGLTF